MGVPPEIADIAVAASHDDSALTVLADWLQQQGDPRGELAALHLQRSRDADTSARIAQLTAALDPTPRLDGRTWRNGFVRSAVIDERGVAELPMLLRSSAAWGIRELTVYAPAASVAIPMIAAEADSLPALRAVALRSWWPDESDLDLEPLATRLPRLERLRIGIPHKPFRVGANVVELSVFASEHWERTYPLLERLWIRNSTGELRWLTRDRFPKLRQLGIVSNGSPPIAADIDVARREHVMCVDGAAVHWQIEDRAAENVAGDDAALVAVGGDGVVPGAVTRLRGPAFWIGRIHGGAPDLHVGSSWISRRHAQLTRGAGWSVADADSSNGTRLEDVRLGQVPMPLRDGAELQVGRSVFRFVQSDL